MLDPTPPATRLGGSETEMYERGVLDDTLEIRCGESSSTFDENVTTDEGR